MLSILSSHSHIWQPNSNFNTCDLPLTPSLAVPPRRAQGGIMCQLWDMTGNFQQVESVCLSFWQASVDFGVTFDIHDINSGVNHFVQFCARKACWWNHDSWTISRWGYVHWSLLAAGVACRFNISAWSVHSIILLKHVGVFTVVVSAGTMHTWGGLTIFHSAI